MVEVWCEDNYDYMKGDRYEYKVASFESGEKALAYMQEKLDAQMRKIAQNVESAEKLIQAYKFGGTDYFIKGSKTSVGFSSWEYVESQAQRVFNEEQGL
ncbi:MAG: hypothetical protein L3J47_08900 [Sulfurovum sp.]|nr:hypothetical protein [Sulfurovum sp.]